MKKDILKVHFNLPVQKLKLAFFATGVLVIGIGISIAIFKTYFQYRIFPNVFVNTTNLGGLSQNEAFYLLEGKYQVPGKFVFTYNSEVFEIPTDSIDLKYDNQSTKDLAFRVHRSGNTYENFIGQLSSFFTPTKTGVVYSYDQELLNNHLATISSQVGTEAVLPSAKVVDGKLIINTGSPGVEVDTNAISNTINSQLLTASHSPISIPTTHIDPSLNPEEVSLVERRIQTFADKKLAIVWLADNVAFNYTYEDLIAFIGLPKGYDAEAIEKEVRNMASEVNREPQNAVFRFEDGRVKEFLPAKDGLSVKTGELESAILEALTNFESTAQTTETTLTIPVDKTAPTITTDQVNNLGIKELLGKGESKFAGSITSRIHNISLASTKFNGILIAPGETMSFNTVLGDVSSFTGYQQAYVIKDGKTVLGDGGGVCQVSTTLFRAALNAGLPIVERRAHSYRVTYYEQGFPPGIDATVYAPTTDLKIKNDTPATLLVQTILDTKNVYLAFEIYGTSDGRKATITKPIVTGVTPPPEDLYIDDPTLPAGQIKQIDWKAWGAKATFNYSVERGGAIIYEKTFVSNFKPWQAKFLRGTGPLN